MPNRPWYLQGLANQLMPDVSGDTPPDFGATNPAPAVDWGDFTPQQPSRYDGWELTNRPAMLPFLGEYTNTATGEKSGGMAWPSMVTEPVQAAQRFIGDGGMWDVENPDNARDGNTLLWSMYGGNALNPAAAIPKGAVGMFAGRKAATADLNALARAEKAAAEGASRDAIWNETGWFQGHDSKWRFEIDDSGAGWKRKHAGGVGSAIKNASPLDPPQMGGMLDHGDLYSSYPDTKKLYVKPMNDAGSDGGFYNRSVFINPRLGNDEALKTGLHETQHYLQAKEGFAPGGDFSGDYSKLAGEVEARNVERRMNMSADERRSTPPWETQDIPDEDQIVRLLSDNRPSIMGSAIAGAQSHSLPMDQASRLARAREMGFDTDNVLYHGTESGPFDAFKLGLEGASKLNARRPTLSNTYVTFASDPKHASEYGDTGSYMVRGKIKDYDLGSDVSWYAKEEGYDSPQDYIDDFGLYKGAGIDDALADQSSLARSEGYDGVRLKLGDLYGRGFADNSFIGGDIVSVFDPRNIRSVNAAFDPARAGENGLLLSDTGRPSLLGSAIAGAQAERPGIVAYHGSPHDFDKFSLDKIGSGEGAQAYGHGLYFAENEGVAKQYRDQLGGLSSFLRYDGEPWDYTNPRHVAANEVQNAGSILDAIHGIKSQLHHYRSGSDQQRRMADALSILERGDEIPKRDAGRMYQVRINANPEDFLDWDKPLSQQSEKISGVLSGMIDKAGINRNNMKNWAGDDWTGSDIVSNLSYGKAQQQMSNKLREAGIPGIRYLDQMSRGAGDGTSNYVVFDDNLIEILKKYGWIPPAAYGLDAMSEDDNKSTY